MPFSIVAPSSADSETLLIALAIIIVTARAGGALLSRLKQPRVMGEILVGVVLGPTVLGQLAPGLSSWLFSPANIDTLSAIGRLGLVIYMFLVGLDLDVRSLRGRGRHALIVSQVSIAIPVLLGAALAGLVYPTLGDGAHRAGFTLFIAAAMAVTAFPVLARVLQDTGLSHTPVGVLALTCAAIDDVTAWCLLAVVSAVATASSLGGVAQTLGLALAFSSVMLLVARPILWKAQRIPVWTALPLALACGWITESIGVHPIFGAFLAGSCFPNRDKLVADIKRGTEHIVLGLMLPAFFVVVGLSTSIYLLNSWYLWGVAGAVLVTALAGKLGGALLAARALGESWRDAAALGVLMNMRGLTELVFLSAGLELQVLSQTVFTVLVLMALITTLTAAPALALLYPGPRSAYASEEGSTDT